MAIEILKKIIICLFILGSFQSFSQDTLHIINCSGIELLHAKYSLIYPENFKYFDAKLNEDLSAFLIGKNLENVISIQSKTNLDLKKEFLEIQKLMATNWEWPAYMTVNEQTMQPPPWHQDYWNLEEQYLSNWRNRKFFVQKRKLSKTTLNLKYLVELEIDGFYKSMGNTAYDLQFQLEQIHLLSSGIANYLYWEVIEKKLNERFMIGDSNAILIMVLYDYSEKEHQFSKKTESIKVEKIWKYYTIE